MKTKGVNVISIFRIKGHRIRASDKHLVYHFFIGSLLFVFVAVLLLLNIKQLMRTDWKHFSLLENGLTLSPYNFITILIATGVCALVAFLYYRFCYDSFKKLLHRQKLARMVLENKWYEADTVQDSGFFTDLQSRSREKIIWFPKIYYQMEKGLLHIRCEITLGKYQDQLLRLEEKLESGLYCELTDKTLHSIYCGVTRMHLWRFNLHKTNAANEELVISLIYGREVQDWKTIYRLLHHYTA